MRINLIPKDDGDEYDNKVRLKRGRLRRNSSASANSKDQDIFRVCSNLYHLGPGDALVVETCHHG